MRPPCAKQQPYNDWLVGGGELGEIIRSIDWSNTPFGARELWSDCLRTASNILVASHVPMCLFWGPEQRLLYNDAFRDVGAGEHPSALGRPLREVWPGISSVLQPAVADVMERGETLLLDNRPVHLERPGQHEDTYVTFGLSPVRTGDGSIAGVIASLQVDNTERKRTDPARRESPETFSKALETMREIFDSSFGFIGLLSVDGTLLKANRTALDFIGVAWPDVAGRPFWDTPWWSHSPEMRELCRTAVQRAADGEVVRLEVTHPAEDGTLHYIDFTITPTKDESGRVVQLIPEGRDMTELRRAEAYQKESESQFRVLSDLPTEGIMIHIGGNILAANRAFADVIGRPGEDLVGMNSFDVTPLTPKSRELVMERSRARYEGSYELELIGKDGNTIFVETSARDVSYRGKTARMVSMRDITERKRAEMALRTSEAQLRASLENSPNVAIQWFDEDGRVLYWNPASEHLYGWTRSEALGKTLEELIFTPEEGAGFLQTLRQVAETGDPVGPFELHVRNRDGGSAWILATVFAIPLDKSRTGFVCMDVDLTERRHAEEALRESDRRKNEFMAMLSHELRNPLAPISNALYVLDHAVSGNLQARRALDVIGRQVTHLTRLIDELLDVTRITRGKIELKRERLDLNEVARRAVEDHRGVCASRGLDLTVSLAPVELWVNGDPTRLAQAIGNIVQNAMKFTPRGGRIAVEVGVDVSRAQAVLTVHDTGAGIAQEMMPRLFEPFAQADRTLDRSQGGLGLGLAVVKGLIDMHGGSVIATSDGVGSGATFAIRLPLEATGAASRERLHDASGGSAPRRVLVIEDNVDAADSMRDALELSGHIVVVAYDGPSGIEEARSLHPEVVFCDIGLPGMDGYEVARTIRATPELCPVTLVALSGYAAKADVDKAIDAGFDTHLAKPARIQALDQVLTGVNPHRS